MSSANWRANYGASFVFSSATQPAFRKCPALPDGFAPQELREIAPDPDELFRQVAPGELPPAESR